MGRSWQIREELLHHGRDSNKDNLKKALAESLHGVRRWLGVKTHAQNGYGTGPLAEHQTAACIRERSQVTLFRRTKQGVKRHRQNASSRVRRRDCM